MRTTRRRGGMKADIAAALLALMLGVASSAAFAQTPVPAANEVAPVAVEVRSRPINAFLPRDRGRVRFGALQFRSGLILTSPFEKFGGLSALRLDASGERFIALSDKGDWFTGRIAYDGKSMTGLADVRSAPMRGSDGRLITAKGWYDTESLAIDDTSLYVGIERVHRILRFEARAGSGSRDQDIFASLQASATGATDSRVASGEAITTPPAMRKLPSNKSIEALVMVPKGLPLERTLIAISERGLDASGNILGFLIGGATPGQFTVRRSNDFDISDAALLPSGDVLLLERKFSWTGGMSIRIRRIPLDTVRPDALIDGPSIFDADLANEIDNMEGLDVHRTAEGDVVLTMISDDNFSLLQRTLLLQFTLIEP